MKVAIAGSFEGPDRSAWLEALTQACPEADWIDAQGAVGTVDAAVVANPPPGALRGLRGLRLIQSLWAGVDRLLDDPTLPGNVPIARMVDPAMNAAMAETALWATLALHRGFFAYAERQHREVWQLHAQRRADELRVLVLGMGAMGGTAAARLAAQGYRVAGWRSSAGRPGPQGVVVHDGGDALWHQLLPSSDIVINLLPLTATTRGLLDQRFFAALPVHASVVNLARGAHVVDADLLAALDRGHLRHAVLDVFHTEPLPRGHRYWSHPKVTVLPHAAALTDARSAAQQVAANLRRLGRGEPLEHVVDRARGY